MPHATWWCHYDLEPARKFVGKHRFIPAEALPTKTSRWDWDEIGMEVSNSFLESLKCYMKRSGSRPLASKRMEYQPTSTNSSNLRIDPNIYRFLLGNFAICFSWKISCQRDAFFREGVILSRIAKKMPDTNGVLWLAEQLVDGKNYRSMRWLYTQLHRYSNMAFWGIFTNWYRKITKHRGRAVEHCTIDNPEFLFTAWANMFKLMKVCTVSACKCLVLGCCVGWPYMAYSFLPVTLTSKIHS